MSRLPDLLSVVLEGRIPIAGIMAVDVPPSLPAVPDPCPRGMREIDPRRTPRAVGTGRLSRVDRSINRRSGHRVQAHRPRMARTRAHLLHWLHRLDAYTNAEFGREHWTLIKVCVTCGGTTTERYPNGVCPRCSRESVPDDTNMIHFRPLRQTGRGGGMPRPARA